MGAELNCKQYHPFDFDLGPQEEARASRLHSESIVIDLLWQGPYGPSSYSPEMENAFFGIYQATQDPVWTVLVGRYLLQDYAVRGSFPEFKKLWAASGVTAGCRLAELGSWEIFCATFGKHQAMFDHLPWVIKALKADDIRRAKAEGKHAAWISTQLNTGINQNFIDLLEPAYDMGLRAIQLTYNSMNLIGVGCTERTDAGVSLYGARTIERMNQLGIIVDTSHCGRQTTIDACQLSTAPVVATHTSAEAVYSHARAKSDEELKALADTGGIIGVLVVPFMIAPSPAKGEKTSITAWLDHIDYIVNIVGWEYVAIGTDWPMQVPKSAMNEIVLDASFKLGHRKKDRIEDIFTGIDGFDEPCDFPNLTRGLVSRGYSDEQIKGILGENFLRVFKEVCG